ncbi:MAG TPA: phytoene/squalene synthase family protein [Mycobacteriales bacterium]
MTSHELDAAGIHGESLRSAYAACRRLHATHGRTYYLATRLLPPAKRPYVHALYGFARYADDLVDRLGPTRAGDPEVVSAAARLESLHDQVIGPAGPGGVLDRDAAPVVRAVRDTMRRFDLPAGHVADFLDSMRTDLTVTGYRTYDDLAGYMWGSAAVIGLLVLPVLGTTTDREVAAPYAADLGLAFQLTNFLRDVGEDLQRGRVYLPAEDMALFGVDREHLVRGVVDGPVRRLLAHEIARTREIYRAAEPGIRLLHADSRDCVRAAFLLYGGILDEIERADYQVLTGRVTIPARRRLAVGLPSAARAYLARRR